MTLYADSRYPRFLPRLKPYTLTKCSPMRVAVRGAPQHREPLLPPLRVSRNANRAYKNWSDDEKLGGAGQTP